MSKSIACFVLVLVGSCVSAFGGIGDLAGIGGGLWHKMESCDDGRLWLVAHEEAAFIRAKIGQWMPVELIDVREGQSYLWRIDKIERVDNRMSVVLFIKYNLNNISVYNINFFDKGENETLDGIVWQKEKETHVVIRCGDGTTRDILFGGGRNLVDLESKYSVSKAMPLWKWGEAGVKVVSE